jgi:hypothetical protein
MIRMIVLLERACTSIATMRSKRTESNLTAMFRRYIWCCLLQKKANISWNIVPAPLSWLSLFFLLRINRNTGMNGTSFFQYCSCRSTQTAWDSVVNDDRCSKTSLRLKLNSCGCASKMKLPIALDTVRSTNTDLTSKYPTKERVASRKKKTLAIRYKHITLVTNTCIR